MPAHPVILPPFLFIPPAIYYIAAGLTTISGRPAPIGACPDVLGQKLESISHQLSSIVVHQDALGQRLESLDVLEREIETISDRLSTIEARLDFVGYTIIFTFTIFAASRLMSWVVSLKFGRNHHNLALPDPPTDVSGCTPDMVCMNRLDITGIE